MSMGANNVGVGNYKGVMLCNRPFGGTAGNVVCREKCCAVFVIFDRLLIHLLNQYFSF